MRILQLILTVMIIFSNSSANADFITFRNRGDWELAAISYGLNIATEDFSNPPDLIIGSPSNPYDPTGSFMLSGTTWNILGGTYDPLEENLVQSGNFDIGISFVEEAYDSFLFGLAYETPNSGSTIQIRDSNGGIFHNRYSCCQMGYDPGFYGILSTISLDLFISPERIVSIDGPLFSRIDNFSIASISVPEPSILSILIVGFFGIGAARRTRKPS